MTLASSEAYSSRSARLLLRLASVVGLTSGVNRKLTRSEICALMLIAARDVERVVASLASCSSPSSCRNAVDTKRHIGEVDVGRLPAAFPGVWANAATRQAQHHDGRQPESIHAVHTS